MHVSRDSTKGPALIESKDKQCLLAKEEDKQCRRQALCSATQKCIRGLACAVQLGEVHANQAAPVTVCTKTFLHGSLLEDVLCLYRDVFILITG